MSKIYQTNLRTIKNSYFQESNINHNNILSSKSKLSNDEQNINEEEIIDELTNRKIQNNVCCLNKENIYKKLFKRNKSYNPKSNLISFSFDDKKTKNMKLKDWLKLNIENTNKISEDIEEIIIKIFVNRYNSFPDNTCPFSSEVLESKKNLELICPRLTEFSIYLLTELYQKFYSLFDYLKKEINFKNIPLNEINKIKKILFYTGNDLKKIFKKNLQKTFNFNLSSILIVIFEEYLIKENKTKYEILEKIKKSQFYKEKERFEKYLNIVKENIYFFDTEKGVETEIQNEDEDEPKINDIEIDDNFFINDNDLTEKDNNITNLKVINCDNEKKENLITKIDEDKKYIHQIMDKENKQINNINNDNNINNNKINNQKIKNQKNEKDDNIENNNLIQNLNIDDLVNYINEDNKDNKKKKKKKKKGKKQDKNIVKENENKDNNYVEEDLVFLNYKRTVEEFTKNTLFTKKIKPKYSEEFLKRLQILSQ